MYDYNTNNNWVIALILNGQQTQQKKLNTTTFLLHFYFMYVGILYMKTDLKCHTCVTKTLNFFAIIVVDFQNCNFWNNIIKALTVDSSLFES